MDRDIQAELMIQSEGLSFFVAAVVASGRG
jgi:hypothetical protein